MIDSARQASLLPAVDEPAVETLDASEALTSPAEIRCQARARARAILDLATVINAAVPLEAPMDWATIGELLQAEGGATGRTAACRRRRRPRPGRRAGD